MNKKDLSKKLNYILKELDMNRTEFINACNKVNPYISKPTVLNAINGNSKGLPKLETINTIINVCRLSNNEKLRNISYDYLMDENISNISNENIKIEKELNLSDKAISRLKSENMIVNFKIISNFIEYTPNDFWQYQIYMKNICKLQGLLNKAKELYNDKIKENENIKSIKYLYCNYKSIELNKKKQELSLKEYRIYLLKILNHQEIFNNCTVDELEESVNEMIKSFSSDLRTNFEQFLQNGKIDNENYLKSDMTEFKSFLLDEYKNTNIIKEYLDLIKEISSSYVSAFLLEFLKTNFRTQYKFIKDTKKYYENIMIYKNNDIDIPYEKFEEIQDYLNSYYNSLEVFNKYLKLLISDSLSSYYELLKVEFSN